jgi:hypothetical protein
VAAHERSSGAYGAIDVFPASVGEMPPNKRMKLTKLSAAPGWLLTTVRTEVPPRARAGRIDAGTASQLIRGVGQTLGGAMARRGLGVLVLGLISLVGPRGTACTVEVRGHRQEYRSARAVFAGTVLSVAPADAGLVAVRLRVDRIWKGPRAKELTVLSDQGRACGGPRFATGEQYLIYAVDHASADKAEQNRELDVPFWSRSRELKTEGANNARERAELDSRSFRFRAWLPF